MGRLVCSGVARAIPSPTYSSSLLLLDDDEAATAIVDAAARQLEPAVEADLAGPVPGGEPRRGQRGACRAGGLDERCPSAER